MGATASLPTPLGQVGALALASKVHPGGLLVLDAGGHGCSVGSQGTREGDSRLTVERTFGGAGPERAPRRGAGVTPSGALTRVRNGLPSVCYRAPIQHTARVTGREP